MYKKTILYTSLILIIILVFLFNKNNFYLSKDSINNKIKIAVCPTYLYLIGDIYKSGNYKIIPAKTTAESIDLFQNKQVDIILSGRTLKPNEPKMKSLIIDQGYSFLAKMETTIYNENLDDITFYTDLDIKKIKKDININRVNKVEDVYDYLDKGIIITSWENTDYNKAKIVHVLENNGERLKISRRPTIYFPEIYTKEAQDLLLIIKNK